MRAPDTYPVGRPFQGHPSVQLCAYLYRVPMDVARRPEMLRVAVDRTVARLAAHCARERLVVLTDPALTLTNGQGDLFGTNTAALIAEATTLDLAWSSPWPPFDPFPRATRVARLLRRVYDLSRDAGYRAAIRLTTWRTSR